jgi:hypothetical protein
MRRRHEDLSVLTETQALARVIREAHEIWIRETSRFLLPICAPDALFWERWTAVRFMADDFVAQYRRERRLLQQIRPFLPPETADRLAAGGEHLGRLQCKLDRVGCRADAGYTVSVLSSRLVRSLCAWCADIEEAVGEVPVELPGNEASRLVGELGLYTGIHEQAA